MWMMNSLMQITRRQTTTAQPGILAISLRVLLILFGLLVLTSSAYIVFHAVTTGDTDPALIIVPIVTLIPFVLGWLIDRKHPGHRIALLFLVMAYASALSIIVEAIARLHEASGSQWLSPGAESIALVLGHSLYIPGVFIPLFLMPLFFPTGNLLSPRWRPLVAIIVVSIAWMVIATALRPWPWPAYDIPDTRPLNGIPGSESFFDTSLAIQSVVTVPAFLLAVFSGFLRFRRAQGIEREQMKWPILALLVFIGIVIVRVLIPELETWEVGHGYPITWTMSMLFPVSIGVAILHQGLWDINIVINRTLIYGVLSALVVALYIAIVGLLGLLFQTQTNIYSGLAAAAIIAVLFQPLRERLQRQVNRLLYGERDDPLAALSELGERLEATAVPEAVLPVIVDTVAQTLRLPYAAITLANGEGPIVVASTGNAGTETINYPLTYQSEEVGTLLVAPRAPGESFSRADERVLRNLAQQAGTAVYAVQLTKQLRRSRQRIITAREEERRRLRRDLHDGLGPQLASQALGMEAASRLMANDPQKAQELLRILQSQAQEAIENVRHLVYDLRPPALDQLGLARALQESAHRYETERLHFNFSLPALPELPAAVEVAAYRIAQEAMTNVVRHADATTCSVALFVEDDKLIVEIADDGRGMAKNGRTGVGLLSMQERAEELNGHCRITSQPGKGTLVRAELPY